MEEQLRNGAPDGGFDWDDEKNTANLAKHGIRFEEAIAIWDGPVVTGQDARHHSEIREISFGMIGGTTVVCVVHTERNGRTRIISARKATRKMKEKSSMPISPERAAEVAAIPDDSIDTSDLPEVSPAFFRTAKLVLPGDRAHRGSIPSLSVSYARNGSSTKTNALGMRPMQERAYEKRGEQYLLIKSPPASGKSRALMFIALDKLQNQGLSQAIVVVPEKAIGASFNDEPLSQFSFWADWAVVPKWNLCNAPGEDGGKVNSVGTFLASDDNVLVCTHATFRFAVEKFGVEAFDGRLVAIDEFHHVSANPDNKLGAHLGAFIARDKVHIVAMTGSYFRGDAEAVLAPADEAKFDTVTYTYYEQLNGYEYLKQLDRGYFFYSGPYADDILEVLDPTEKTIIHIPSVNSRESMGDKIKEVEHIIDALANGRALIPRRASSLSRRRPAAR